MTGVQTCALPIFDLLKRQAKFLVINEKKELGNISIVFCSDEYLLKINDEYLSHNYYTDIITFDYCENSVISGDLFISLDRISENARIFEVQFNEELYRVIFHGLLHLVAYKDKTEAEKKVMRAKEDYYLKGMKFEGK